LILAFIFFLGLKVLESSSRIARIGAPRQRSSALFWWWRSKRITSSLPRGVNRCVAEKKSTKTAVKSKTDLKKMTPAASSRRGQSWLDINWGEDERPATIETLQNAGRPLPSQIDTDKSFMPPTATETSAPNLFRSFSARHRQTYRLFRTDHRMSCRSMSEMCRYCCKSLFASPIAILRAVHSAIE